MKFLLHSFEEYSAVLINKYGFLSEEKIKTDVFCMNCDKKLPYNHLIRKFRFTAISYVDIYLRWIMGG